MAVAPNNVSYKNNTHTPGISIHYFPKDVAVWPNGRVSIVDRGDFTLQRRRPHAQYHFEDACDKHKSLVKSGEDK